MNLDKLSKYQPIGDAVGRLTKEPKWGTRTNKRLEMMEGWKEKLKKRTVLDMGCNNGMLTMKATELGAKRAVGVDKYDCIQGAREIAKEKGLNTEFWQFDLDKPEFKDFCPKFDVVFVFSLLTHLKDPIGMLRWIDFHTNDCLFFETNHGAKNENQIDLVTKHTTFVKKYYLGQSGDEQSGIHHMWVLTKHIQRRRRKHRYWNELPVTFIPLNKIEGWKPSNMTRYGNGHEYHENLVESIKKHGLREPLIVEKFGEEDFYRAHEGGHRYLALKELGYTDAPCKIGMTHIEELEKRIKEAVKPYMGLPIALSGGIDSSLLAALIKPRFAITVKLPGDERFNEIKYAEMVTKHLGIKHIIVDLDESKFDMYMDDAVKAIGRPIPHFNIFPLYVMYRKLHELEEKELILGDGPDETMCGYARELIIAYLYKIYEFEAFEHYKPIIDKMLPEPAKEINKESIEEDRKDMDDMSDGIAKLFVITNHRPYQDEKTLDNFMFDLPMKWKIKDVEYGKYALRKIAEKYLPKEIAWRKKKVGGPVYPVNQLKDWLDKGEFDKTEYLKYQECLLQENN